MKIRSATESDAPALASLLLAAAAAHDPWTAWIPPRAHRDARLLQALQALLVRRYLSPSSSSTTVKVAELTSPSEIVALSVWDTSDNTTTNNNNNNNDNDNSDEKTSSTSLDILVRALCDGRHRFAAADGARYVFLDVLATHPDHQGRGYAKALVRWGVEQARGRRAAVGLAATGPRGYVMLSGMGFSDFGAVPVPVPAAVDSNSGDDGGSDGDGRDRRQEIVLKALRLDAAAVQASHPGLWAALWKYITT